MPQQPKRATIRDVAEATGLSPAAVSYALRGIQTSEETQERVRRAAAELGYKVDRIARALASGRTGTIGLLFGSLEDLWQQLLGVGIGSALLARDHYALLVDAAGDPERELLLAHQLRDQRVDGLIVQPLDPSDERWSQLAESLPVVSIGEMLLWLAAILTIVTGYDYLRASLAHLVRPRRSPQAGGSLSREA